MKNHKIKISLDSPEGPKDGTNNTGINFMIFTLILMDNSVGLLGTLSDNGRPNCPKVVLGTLDNNDNKEPPS